MPPAAAGYDYKIRSTETALQEAGEQMSARCRAVQQSLFSASIEFGQAFLSGLNSLPQFITHDSQFRLFDNAPFTPRPGTSHSLVGVGNFYEPGAVPYHSPDIELPPQHLPDSAGAPGRVPISRARSGRWYFLGVQCMGNLFQ